MNKNDPNIRHSRDECLDGSNAPSALPTARGDDPAILSEDDYAEFRLLVENSNDILCRLSSDGLFLYLSPASLTILGYHAAELVGRNKSELVHEEDRALMLPALMPDTGKSTLDHDSHFAEYRLRRKDGVHIWAQTTSRLIRDAQGRIREIIAVIRDVTQRKQIEDNLRHSERLASIGTLAAGIAHEINNPLGAILMAAHAAREFNQQPGNPAEVDEMIAQISSDARRAANIVRNVLQFARQEESLRIPTNLQAIVLRARMQGLRHAGNRPMDIKVRGPDISPWILASPLEIEQTLINLVINSIDAGATRIHLTVRPAADTNRISVCVIDNGKGMTSEQIKHAFDPFYSARSQFGGAGLGLSIAHGIIAAHGGTIRLTSQPSRGTTITFDLPLTSPPTSESSAHA